MGVGTYGEDYSGAGRSINVDGPLGSDEDYAAHRKDYGRRAMTREDYDRDAYDQINEEMLTTVAKVAEEVGLFKIREGRFSGARVQFDREITGIASGNVFDIGWRSWQHDFVIAIGPASQEFGSFIANEGEDANYAVWEKGRSPQRLKADYETVLDDLEKLVRYSLLENSFETSVKTSGYTSRADKAPEDIQAQISELKVKVKAGITMLARGAETALPTLSAEERLEVASAILGTDEWYMGSRPQVLVPVYNKEEDEVSLWDPAEAESGIMVSRSYPAELGDYLRSLPDVEGFAPIPFCAETEAFFASMTDTRRGMRIAVSAEQYSDITSEPCVVAWHDDATEESGTIVLHGEEPSATMAP